jgi:hypothetical protein
MGEKIASHLTCDKRIGKGAMINGWTFSRLLRLAFFVTAMSPAALADDAQQEDEAPPPSITLTLPDGSRTTLLPYTIKRIRKVISPEAQSGARTRIDWLQVLVVRESPEDVAALVEQSGRSLAKLRLPEGSPIWFKGGIAQGPIPLTRDQLKDGVRSAIFLGDNLQFLGSTPDEVRQELSDKGGNALPEAGAVASLSSQGRKSPEPAQRPQEQEPQPAQSEPEQAQQGDEAIQPQQAEAEQTPQAEPEQPQEVGDVIQPQQAQAEQAPEPIQPQPEQVQLAGETVRLPRVRAESVPQFVQPEPEQTQLAGEIVRLQQVRTESVPQFVQPESESAQPVGEIIRLQQARAESGPQAVQPESESAQPVGEIIRLQQAKAEQAPQFVEPQPEPAQQAGEIIRLQQTQAEPVAADYPATASAGQAGAAVLQAGRKAVGALEWILGVR